MAFHRTVRIVHRIDTLPNIQGIRYQLHQLFLNLLSNAIKFNLGVPTIHISTENVKRERIRQTAELDSRLNYIRLLFRDNGIGIDSKHKDQVFKLFQRLNEKTFEGTGIGLALCKRIVENHKGVISLVDNNLPGSAFEVILPVRQN